MAATVKLADDAAAIRGRMLEIQRAEGRAPPEDAKEKGFTDPKVLACVDFVNKSVEEALEGFVTKVTKAQLEHQALDLVSIAGPPTVREAVLSGRIAHKRPLCAWEAPGLKTSFAHQEPDTATAVFDEVMGRYDSTKADPQNVARILGALRAGLGLLDARRERNTPPRPFNPGQVRPNDRFGDWVAVGTDWRHEPNANTTAVKVEFRHWPEDRFRG